MQERDKNKAAMKSLVSCTRFLHGTIFLTILLSLYLVGLENCKFSLKMPQGMQYTLLVLRASG